MCVRRHRVGKEARTGCTLIDEKLVVEVVARGFAWAGLALACVSGVAILIQIDADGATGFGRVVIGEEDVNIAVTREVADRGVTEAGVRSRARRGKQLRNATIFEAESKPRTRSIVAKIAIHPRLAEHR